MKKAISLLKPETLNDLKDIVNRVWNDFDQLKINSMVLSFFQRLELVILNSGNSIQPFLRSGLADQQFVIPGMPQDVVAMKDIITDILPEEDEVEMTVMKNGPFTEEEDMIILNCYLKFGTKWDKIAAFVEGRTAAAAIKNRFIKHIRNLVIKCQK
jgi:cobalamin biosynthesis Co2+ chelatase CbiK